MNNEMTKRFAAMLYFKAGKLIDIGDSQHNCGALYLAEYNYGKDEGFVRAADHLLFVNRNLEYYNGSGRV